VGQQRCGNRHRPPGGSGFTLSLDVEPGPGIGSKPLSLEVYNSAGSMLTSAQIGGREALQVSTRGALTGKLLRLHVNGGGVTVPGDARVLNFRVFDVGCAEDLPSTSALLQMNADRDIASAAYRQELVTGVTPPDGVLLGRGWYAVESSAGTQFRWAANDVELVVTSALGTERQVELDVEPGPGVGSQAFVLQVLDAEGDAVAALPVQGRQVVRTSLPTRPGSSSVFHLHLEGGGMAAPNDARTLNFRVFSVR